MNKQTIALFFSFTSLIAASCSSGPFGSGTSDKDLSKNGPTVLDAKLEPSTIELNRKLQQKRAEITTEVQDVASSVTNVKLKFTHIPISIPMTHIGGTTWRAEIPSKQLKQLAVNGQTMKYEANIIAKSRNGKIATSSKPITIAIKAPNLSSNAS